ncbi:MAG: DUF5050 domain-containing protein [Clostridiales bacterium]|nr:DUF5050 domain-containing protein [Clostridiales bacterium]
MKKIEYRKSLVMLVALACLCTACGEDNETTKGKKDKAADADISVTVEDSDDGEEGSGEDDNGESTDGENGGGAAGNGATSGSDDPASDPSTDHVTEVIDDPDAQEDPSDPSAKKDPSDNQSDPSGSATVPATEPSYLGAGNLANGGFATGDGKCNYYVIHPEDGVLAIVKETRATGSRVEIYRTSYKPGVVLDSLTLSGDALYFRENALDGEIFGIQKMDLSSGELECVTDGEISGITVCGDSLYFCRGSALVKCDLDGFNERVLFESNHSAMTAKVAFCISGGRIYFADPANFATGGMFFGRLCSMDLDGKDHAEIPAEVDACNDEIFFSDGERLFFYGNTDSDGSGYYSCKLDGSDLQLTAKASPTSRNISEDVDVVATPDELYVDKDGNGHELLYNGNIRMGRIVIVGDEIYFMGPDDTNRSTNVTKRIKIDGSDEAVLG